MNRASLYAIPLIALGLAAGLALGRRGESVRVAPPENRLRPPAAPAPDTARPADRSRRAARLEQRVTLLASRLEAEAVKRHRLEEQLAALADELAALRGEREDSGPASAAEAAITDTAEPPAAADATTAMQRALLTAGVDEATAADIVEHHDELALAEIYLRDRAAREGWLKTPAFAEEMAEIAAQRVSVRDEVGDDAYDRYLAALDRPNRVAVHEVLHDSPAAAAGLEAGDVVLRYGDDRIFSTRELVQATRGGTAGETVRLEIIRQGERLEIEVPRGPLGVRIAPARG